MHDLDRRRFLKGAGAAAIAGLAPGWLQAAANAGSKTDKSPNIVVVLADDYGYGDLGCQDPESRIPTPNLNRLAKQGVRFTDAHSPSAVCSPTRYGLLTGRYAWRSRLKRGVLGPWDRPLIAEDRLTLPKMLKKHGYDTACVGKWHLGMNWPTVDGKRPYSNKGRCNVDFSKPITEGPTTRGFDSYFGTAVPNYPPYCFVQDDHVVGTPTLWCPDDLDFGNHGPLELSPGPALEGWDLHDILPALGDRAVDYIEGEADKTNPFFLYMPLTAPHTPIVPSKEFQGKSGIDLFGDLVMEVDHTVGRVMEALERTGQAEDTLFIFTSDNGPEAYCYERAREYDHYSMDGLRGVKRDAWEGGHRVPFIARWPGRISKGTTSDETICLTDIMATCATIVDEDLPADAAEDSYDVLPALLGAKLDAPIREATVHHSCRGDFAIRKGDWVYIDASTGADRPEPEWFKEERGYEKTDTPGLLYNLREDLKEAHNHYSDKPEKVKELKALLERYKKEGRSVPAERR